MIKIMLTEEQHTWLLRFLNREWDEELNYQASNGDVDTQYLEDMLDVYTAVLGKPDGWIQAYCHKDDLEGKLKELEELK